MNMDYQRWRQVETLYHAALEREPLARAAFLEEACAGDESLRREVEALVAADGMSASLLDSPALDFAARLVTEEETRLFADKRLGHYRILSQLGKGGMGEVWLAEDTQLSRKVAIKLLPVEFTTDAGRVRRFAQEARAASALNHPNIITIHEIGEYEQQGKFSEAIAELNQAYRLNDGPQVLAALGHAYAMSGQRVEAQKALTDLQETAKRRYVSPYDLATIYAGLGEKEQALAWLERLMRIAAAGWRSG